MRKIKKIGEYLVVRFNAKEMKEYGSTLGEYGVIDAELYTGHLDVDKGLFAFYGINNLEEAAAQLKVLESKHELENTADEKANDVKSKEIVSKTTLCNAIETNLKAVTKEQDKELREKEGIDQVITISKNIISSLYENGMESGYCDWITKAIANLSSSLTNLIIARQRTVREEEGIDQVITILKNIIISLYENGMKSGYCDWITKAIADLSGCLASLIIARQRTG